MISSKKFFAEYKNSEKLNIMRIKSGRADNMIRLATELPKAAGNSDIYMSMNPLTRVNHSVRRDQEHIARLKWLYVDLDYYNTVYKAYTKDQIMGLQNLFQRYENIDGVEDTVEYKLYCKNIHSLYVNGIDCMVEKGDTDRDSVRARIIVHNESVRPFDALRTAEKINELAEIYTRQNKNLPKEQRFNVNQRIADDLKGKYTVRQIIRYKNFDSLIDELKEVVINHGMSISEISTYHTLTVDEQALLAHYIKQYHIPGEKLTLPSIDEIRNMVDWTTESNNSSEESSSDIQPDNDNTGSIKEETTSDFPTENEDFEELKKKAAKKLKENEDKKNDKIQSTALAIQKKTKQLERDFYNYLTDSEQIELDLSTFIKELETSIETLSNLKESVTKYERR